MKIKDHEDMEKYLTKKPSRKVLEEKVRKELNLPKGTEVEGSRILAWINGTNKLSGSNKMPITDYERKVVSEIETAMIPKTDKYGNPERYNDRIQLKDTIEKDFFQNKLKNLRKAPVKIVKKPTVQQQLSFEDWLSVIDPYWMEEEPNNKPKLYLMREPKKKKKREGIVQLIWLENI